ncbi:MAG: aminotransferase class V-fold PLP-dependent enzyme [Bacillota bacterium]
MQDPMDCQSFRPEFPVTRHYCYLNHAANAPEPLRVVRAVEEYLRDASEAGTLLEDRWWLKVETARSTLASFIGASPDELAWVDNVSHAAMIVANGLDWRPGDKIVGTAGQFPANIYPWLNLRRHGIEYHMVPARDGLLRTEDILGAIDDRTRVVAISLVEFFTGQRHEVARIGARCREKGVLFFVDGIQGVGAIPVDVRAMNIDFLAFGAQKWMLGPNGVGALYVRRELVERLHPVTASWLSVPERFDFANLEQGYIPEAGRFEGGTGNLMGLVGFAAALEYFALLGAEPIWETIRGLTDHLIEGLQSRGYQILSPLAPEARSGIVGFYHPREAADRLVDRLRDEGIIVAVRQGAVRVSPHFYNTVAEIDWLLEELD